MKSIRVVVRYLEYGVEERQTIRNVRSIDKHTKGKTSTNMTINHITNEPRT